MGCFGPIPIQTPGRFGPIPFQSGRFGLACFGQFWWVVLAHFILYNFFYVIISLLAGLIDFMHFQLVKKDFLASLIYFMQFLLLIKVFLA